MVSFVRILVLIWADVLADYAMWVMMTYLTNVWKLNLVHAAGIINIWRGVTSILPIGAAFLVDAFVGHYVMLLFSSLAYSIGLGFLSMSTPPVLADATGTCSAYSPECIGHTQKALFYTALALISVGIAGHGVSLGSFFADQLVADSQGEAIEMERNMRPAQCIGMLAVFLVPIVGIFVLPYIKPWSVRFGIPAICSVVATFLFLTGSCAYKYIRRNGSPLTSVFRVFLASSSKICHPCPEDPNRLYETSGPGLHLVSHTRGLSCLDRAAIILPTKTLEEQENNRWRLCRVTEVEETKIAIRMIPMWITFIICGLVSSIGDTYFLEQANRMNPKVGRLKVPLPILLMFYDGAKSKSGEIYAMFANCFVGMSSRKYLPPIGTALAMVSSILCCITAAKVEDRRLGVIERHGLLDKPDERIPMTIFWLVPQFILLGGLDGISESSIAGFFEDQAPPSMSSYLNFFTSAVLGLGKMGSVLSVHLAGKISERGGKSSWFQETLNKSRLDKYYWTLAAMAAVNLGLYILVAIWYAYRDSEAEEEELPENDEAADQPYDNVNCCCCCG